MNFILLHTGCPITHGVISPQDTQDTLTSSSSSVLIIHCSHLLTQDGEVVGINCITVMAASGISFAIPSDMAREFMKNAKERVKTLRSSSGLAPSKFKAQERFYIGKLTFRFRFRNEFYNNLGPTYKPNFDKVTWKQ